MCKVYIFQHTQHMMTKNTDSHILHLGSNAKQLNCQTVTTYWYPTISELFIVVYDMLLMFRRNFG
jgi:hypothetical protein